MAPPSLESSTRTLSTSVVSLQRSSVSELLARIPALSLPRFPPPDGLMGMAFQSISEYNSPPVFQTLVSQGKVAEPVFGFTLLKSGSELYLGGVDSSKFDGSLTYAPVTQAGYWQISLDGASVGSNSVFSSGVEAIVDTGTTLIIGDTSNVASIYAAIPGSKDASSTLGSGTYTIPCDSVPDNVSFTIAGQEFSISADNFSLGPASDGSSDCVGGILGDDSLGKHQKCSFTRV